MNSNTLLGLILIFFQINTSFALENQSIHHEPDLLNQRAQKLQESYPDSCIYLAQLALTEWAEKNVNGKATSYWNMAQGYLYKHEYHSALIYSLKGLELFEENDSSAIYQELLTTLGWTYYDMGNASRAYPYHQKALKIARLRKDHYSEVRYINALGLDAMSENHLEKALDYFMEAKQVHQQYNNAYPGLEATLAVNTGVVYTKMKQWQKAKEELLNALAYDKPSVSLSIESLTNLCKVEMGQKNYKAASTYLNKAAQYVPETSYSFVLLEYYHTLQELKQITGDTVQAYEALIAYQQLYKKVHNRTTQSVMNYLLSLQETQLHDKQLIIEKNQTLQYQGWIIGGISILISILLILLVIYRYKTNNEKKKLKQQLLEAQLQQTLTEKENLSYELSFKSKKLEELALSISERNEIVQAMRAQVKASPSKEIQEGWRLLISLIERAEETGVYSQEVINDFMSRLHRQFPHLTEKDTSLIVDIRNNLTSKEIALKHHIEVRSVEMGRYRLRKKLNLEKGESLKEFIMGV
ncbi:tetratricopeptide repeat protein [Algivirga pacifica]|uniref:Tetratricopeptide repeat-containing protein n=1 Tax=Algivirga pacifica TaxID=1162670 RepID=A0ABP9DI82_9BACT